MIKFKKNIRRNLRRDRTDELSIITGGRPIIHLGPGRQNWKDLKRVRTCDEKLKKSFEIARATAYADSRRRCTKNIAATLSSSVTPPSQPPETPPNPKGHCTIKCVPPLVTTAQTKKAVLAEQHRGILKQKNSKNDTNSLLNHQGPDSHYWSVYYSTRSDQKPKLTSTVFNTSSKINTKPTSAWKITSSMPMTRQNARIVQMEMASALSGEPISNGSAASSSSCSYFGQAGTPTMTSIAFPNHFIPSLVNQVVPPPTPDLLISDDAAKSTASILSTPNSRGVFQSGWMNRNMCNRTQKAVTRQYSIEQLVDMLCGFTKPDSLIATQLFEPSPSSVPGSSLSPNADMFQGAASNQQQQSDSAQCMDFNHYQTVICQHGVTNQEQYNAAFQNENSGQLGSDMFYNLNPNEQDSSIFQDAVNNQQQCNIFPNVISNQQQSDFFPDMIHSHQQTEIFPDMIHNQQQSEIFKNGNSNRQNSELYPNMIPNQQQSDIFQSRIPGSSPPPIFQTRIPDSSSSPIFQPRISDSLQSPIFQTRTSDQSQSRIFENVFQNQENNHDDDNGETSIYFKKPPKKKKSVNFLTDSQDNIRVTHHYFDPFSQNLQPISFKNNEFM